MSPVTGESRIRKFIEKVNPWLPRAGEEGEGTRELVATGFLVGVMTTF